MAIHEFSPQKPRGQVAIIGEMPPKTATSQLEIRELVTRQTTVEELHKSADFGLLEAVVWTQDPKKLITMPRELGAIIPQLLNFGVRVYLRIAEDERQTSMPRQLVVKSLLDAEVPVAGLSQEEWLEIPADRRERQRSFLAPCVFLTDTAVSWEYVAAGICDRRAGPPPKLDLEFDETAVREAFGSDGHAERALLLQRAFWNCSSVDLKPLIGGMSGAPVFKAYATLADGMVAQNSAITHPHLYFVKIGSRKKIVDEYDKYCSYVFEYVPFYLGPRINRDRCNLGAVQGILVGDFVESAENLIACARGGRCGHAISNLFDKTLAGWRKQSVPDTATTLGSHLGSKWFNEGSADPISLPDWRKKIVCELGVDTEVDPLKDIFERYADTAPLVAPAHGDMHATNILVRHGDAIIIDFEKLENRYPMTYDPASLEGGLLTDGFISDLQREEFRPQEILSGIDALYEYKALEKGKTVHSTPGHDFEWYFDAVNQIRTLSWSSENADYQYALTLALCLVRKGCNPHPSLKEPAANHSRAMAFCLGQKLFRSFDARRTGRPSSGNRG